MPMRARGMMGVPMRGRGDMRGAPMRGGPRGRGGFAPNRDNEGGDHFENPDDVYNQRPTRGGPRGGPRGGQQ
jgi:hypothetical protein